MSPFFSNLHIHLTYFFFIVALVTGSQYRTTGNLRMMTWNLWNEHMSLKMPWDIRIHSILQKVRSEDPDIIAVQECTQQMTLQLNQTLRDVWLFMTPWEASDEHTMEGLVVFSKYPIRHIHIQLLGKGQFDSNQRRVIWCSIQGLRLGNLHLAYDPSDGKEQLLLTLKESQNADVILGDLNVYHQNWQVFQKIWLSHGWESVYEGPTWSTFAENLTNPADQILFRPNRIRLLDSHIVNVKTASDHCAVVVDLRLPSVMDQQHIQFEY